MTIPLRGPIERAHCEGRRLLRRALAVVQFSPVLKIADSTGAGIAGFQDAIRDHYPLLESEIEHMMQIMVVDGEVTPKLEKAQVWRLFDAEKNWRVSLTSRSIAIETQDAYENGRDFTERARMLIGLVGEHFRPAQAARVGVRFINLAKPDEVIDACASELVSITGNPELRSAELSWNFHIEEGSLLLRSGVMEAKTSYDVMIQNPVDERTWYLDIDVYNDVSSIFNVDEIAAVFSSQVNRAHAIYMWAVPCTAQREGGTQ